MTLDLIRDERSADLYPRAVLEGCETALVLFAAAFHGKQDAIWVADAGLTATCVDVDLFKLMQMEDAYPAGWEFVCADVFEYAARTDRQWDVVSIDCPTNLFERCAELMPLWCLLARKAVVIGCAADTKLVEPDGWEPQVHVIHRSNFNGGVYWAVFERC